MADLSSISNGRKTRILAQIGLAGMQVNMSNRLPLLLVLVSSVEEIKEDTIGDNKPNSWKWVTLLALVLFGLAVFMADEDFLSEEDGRPVLAPWRKAKMEKELEEMEEGEQYVLKATEPGYYPCFNCPHTDKIFLEYGEVWKYGVTSKGQGNRYKSGLPVSTLVYATEFIGELRECYRLEKIKIYNYALLPENLRRTHRLIRPPGNKQDN